MKPPIHLLKINQDSKSSMGFTVEVEPEFEEWFLRSQGLEKWDETVFTSWFKAFLDDAMRDRMSQRCSDQQQVDVWSRDGLEE